MQRRAPGRVRARREGRAWLASRAAGPQLTVPFSLSVSAVGDAATASDVPQDGLLLHGPFARKPKRIRTAFSPSQLLRLERAFEKNHYVVGAERKQLAGSLSLSETQVMNGPSCARGPGGGGPGGCPRGRPRPAACPGSSRHPCGAPAVTVFPPTAYSLEGATGLLLSIKDLPEAGIRPYPDPAHTAHGRYQPSGAGRARSTQAAVTPRPPGPSGVVSALRWLPPFSRRSSGGARRCVRCPGLSRTGPAAVQGRQGRRPRGGEKDHGSPGSREQKARRDARPCPGSEAGPGLSAGRLAPR